MEGQVVEMVLTVSSVVLILAVLVVIMRLRAAIASQMRTIPEAVGASVNATLQQRDGLLQGMRDDMERLRNDTRNGQAEARREFGDAISGFRSEFSTTFAALRSELTERGATNEKRIELLGAEVGRQLDAVRQQQEQRLEQIRVESRKAADASREETVHTLGQQRTALLDTLTEFRNGLLATLAQAQREQREKLTAVGDRIEKLTASNMEQMDKLRAVVEGRLESIRTDNAKQLEEMRNTVNEKLQSTLEQRLGDSFKQVSQHLESVQRGLGEMQTLATGVGDLKRVLTNVKVRGNWGEVQLGSLLEQMLTPDQYLEDVAVQENSGERVEFAIKFPGRGSTDDEPLLLPIDAKFPQESYLRLIDAHERADSAAFEAASKELERAVKACASDIHAKYIHPPTTTDYGVMFLPVEGLYAEIARRPGLLEVLQRDYRVMVAGPSTLAALLSTFQMGFRSLAIQKRTTEVWQVLGKVKKEFGKFELVLDKVQVKLRQAGDTIDKAKVRTRVMGRSLRDVEEMAAGTPELMLEQSDEEPEPIETGMALLNP